MDLPTCDYCSNLVNETKTISGRKSINNDDDNNNKKKKNSNNDNNYKRWKLVTHCHLRLPIPSIVLGFSRKATRVHNLPLHQISVQSDSLQLHCSDLAIFSLGIVHHLRFDQKSILTLNHYTASTDQWYTSMLNFSKIGMSCWWFHNFFPVIYSGNSQGANSS